MTRSIPQFHSLLADSPCVASLQAVHQSLCEWEAHVAVRLIKLYNMKLSKEWDNQDDPVIIKHGEETQYKKIIIKATQEAKE